MELAHLDELVRHRRRTRRQEIRQLVARRVVLFVPILLGVSLAIFLLASASPFDPLSGYLGAAYERTTSEQRDAMAHALGLHASWFDAWRKWIDDFLHGDLGQSRIFGQPVVDVIEQRLPFTLLLSSCALFVSTIFGTVLGVMSGLREDSLFSRIVSAFALAVQSIPPFVLSLGTIGLFAVSLAWFPSGGVHAPDASLTVWEVAYHLVLPTSVLAISQLPWIVLSLHESVREALATDPVRMALARGLTQRTIVLGHVLPVSLMPLVSLLGARLPELIVGALLVEEVFAWPGIAGAIIPAARQLDFPLLTTLTLGTTCLVLLGSLCADVLYSLLDPRVRAGE